MKKIMIVLLALLPLTMFAQNDVTTFLGIPIDGFKPAMRQKLIGKGFTPQKSGTNEYFEGEFNGQDVNVYISTNNNKVCRLMICDANTTDEANIKVRFNTLVSQFENNKRYIHLDDQTLSDDVNISYEMTVKNKNFEAIFYQRPDPEKTDTTYIQNKLREELLQKYTQEQLDNPTEEMQSEITSAILNIGFERLLMKPVWFKITRFYNKYYITMYYDNVYNQANGEDL